MTCKRCGSFLIDTKAYDEEATIWLWLCLNCGDRFDDTIRFHRALSKPPDPRPWNTLPVYDPTMSRLIERLRERLGAA